MASEAISEHLISKNYLGEYATRPLSLARLYWHAAAHIHNTSGIHVIPLLNILAMGLPCNADINKCEVDDLNNCHENAQCTDTEGSYSCSCNPGYTGDGVSCRSK